MRRPLTETVMRIGNERKQYRFRNGYGASVVRGAFTHGGDEGLWELAVLEWPEMEQGPRGIAYDTPVTEDVIGYLTEDEVDCWLDKIEAIDAHPEVQV